MPLELRISESDLPPSSRATLSAITEGNTVLGDSTVDAVLDAVPSAVASRLRRIMPPGMTIKEIEIRFAITGSLFGNGIEGEATVRYGIDSESLR